MRNRKGLLGVASLSIALIGVVALSAAGADDEPIVVPKDIADAVNKMADEAGKGADLKKPSEALFKKHPEDLKRTMWIFKPREKNGKGGFGVGKPDQYKPDGIEALIITHAKKDLTGPQLKAAAPDFIRLADVTIAMAELTQQYKPQKPAPGQIPKNWTKYADEMKTAATNLKTAVKANKPDDTKKAFTMLYSSCTHCHSEFRD